MINKDLVSEEKQFELQLLFEFIKHNTFSYKIYAVDVIDFEETINRKQTGSSDIREKRKESYTGEDKFNRAVKNIIKKLELLKVAHIVNQEVDKSKIVTSKTTYEKEEIEWTIWFPDQTFQFAYSHLSQEERTMCSFEIIMFMILHHQKFDLKTANKIFDNRFTKQNFLNCRKMLANSVGYNLIKNKIGNYEFDLEYFV